MRSHNPALRGMSSEKRKDYTRSGGETMTVQGTTNKIMILLLCALGTAALTWTADQQYIGILMMTGLIGGLIFAMITIFKADWAPVTAPIYALLEGLFLGGISLFFNNALADAGMGGIVVQAVAITFAVFLTMLIAYKTGAIKATEKFKSGVIMATGGIFLLYLTTFILGLFGINVPYLHSAGPIGIGISAVIVIIAALNLIIDFDMIEQGEAEGAPQQMEWYAAFGLMITLVWLYLEILRLLWMLYSFFDD